MKFIMPLGVFIFMYLFWAFVLGDIHLIQAAINDLTRLGRLFIAVLSTIVLIGALLMGWEMDDHLLTEKKRTKKC